MSKVARANIVITLEYDVEQTFEDDMSIHDMRDNWEVFMDCLLYTSPSPRDRG